MMRLAAALVAGSLMLVACADPPKPDDQRPLSGQPGATPAVAEIVCEGDGSTTVRTPEVVVQPDGIHMHVDVTLDEAARVDGLWFDREVQPGGTDLVTVNPPGALRLACWPVSQLESSSFVPEEEELEVLDPAGIYVNEELECLPGDDTAGWSADWGSPGPDRDPPVTPAEAESVLERLEPGDVVAYAGYPERPGYRIAVQRDERTIAIMWFYRDGDTVDSDSGGICEGEAVFTSTMIEHGDDS